MSAALAPLGGFRTAFLINLASAAGGSLVRFGVSLLLARLLVPAELGLVAIALALVGVAQVLRDLGVGAYLQREPTLDAARFASCLGVLCGSTAVMALVLAAAAVPLARQLGQPGLVPLLAVLVLGFVLQPFSLVMSALLQRDLAAGAIARVSRLGGLAYALTALGLAALGCGALSLAWAQVVNILVCSLAYARWWPPQRVWRPSLRGWSPVLRFGRGALLNSGLAGVNAALPDLLLGQLGTVHQVGLLGRANAVVQLLQTLAGPAIDFGMLRRLAELHHREAVLAPLLQRATALLTGVGWPVLALIALYHAELVALLYGPVWRDSAAAIPPLAATAALGLVFHYGNVALAAIGRPQLAALPLAVSVLARCGLAWLCYDGQLVSLAWALLSAALVTLPVQALLAWRWLGWGGWDGARLLGRSLLPCLVCAGSAAAVHGRLAAPLVLGLAVLAWALALWVVRHALVDELRQWGLRLRSTMRK